ncbi:unnamed protein product [Plutella xylostella]|uniref:(diamondback moth) hypothetical protein n=1 Tax=Plutella xylostella TaxID=51655 RepID=A0A8S4EJM3_PLUXY|nr:unnamed protein product [Plutella xylostella]
MVFYIVIDYSQLCRGDRIKSIKIQLSGTPLEDAVSILSLASPYPVQLEVQAGRAAGGAGRAGRHPLWKRAGSMHDVSEIEKETQHLRPQSPKQHSDQSTLENKQPKGIKKVITDKIITSTLERSKKERKDGQPSTLERENEKNAKMANRSTLSDIPSFNKTEKVKTRHSTGTDYHIENGAAHIEHSEVQTKEAAPKKAMKFGIRVLPPNVPTDDKSKQGNVENGTVGVEKDETDKPRAPLTTQLSHENEVKKPVVAKRREKAAPPIPNARTMPVAPEPDVNSSLDSSRGSEPTFTTFARNDANLSGIRRDKNGIPLELPAHMLEAARSAKNNRKSSTDMIGDKDKVEVKKEEAPKPSKKSKGKAPSPPEIEKNKTDDSMIEQMKNTHDFLNSEKQFSSLLHDTSIASTDNSGISYTSTPKVDKTKSKTYIDESMSFSQDDIDDIVSKPFKKEPNDSMQNLHGVTMYHSDRNDKGSTTIELNYSDITIHSSPNDTTQSVSDEASILDENERKAASLGDLSRFAMKTKGGKPTMSTLERAQSLDISTDDSEINDNTLSPKKKKAYSVVETTFFESNAEDTLPEIDAERGVVIKHKEPRLSLNIAKTSAMEGLNTFQRNRLKKGSEFGTLEDAIVKGSSSSIDSDKNESQYSPSKKEAKEIDLSMDMDPHETSDDLARKILDENMKVHLKLVSEFAKTTSDGSDLSSLDSTWEKPPTPPRNESLPKYEEKVSIGYDTNIPDDMKVSSNSYVNSLERPKSEMMRKLLAKNPILNVHIDKTETVSQETPMTDASKSAKQQPDIVTFDSKSEQSKQKNYDDFISNIRVGSNSSTTLKLNQEVEYSTEYDASPYTKSYTKSIEIGEPTRRFGPDVVEGIKRKNDEKESRVLYMEPPNVVIKMTEEPVQKTVTVNVAEDQFGNKIITQNVEKVMTKYAAAAEAPLEVEQFSYGVMKRPDDINQLNLEEGDVKDIDKSILDEIRRQNPSMHFTSDEPAYTKTETIILNTELDEKEAMALMEKIKNDPSFMNQKTPEELSRLGIRIIRDLDDVKTENKDTVEVTKTRYSINKTAMSEKQKETNPTGTKAEKQTRNEQKKEINVEKIAQRQRAPPLEEPLPTYELDIDMLNDFISNERHHSGKQHAEMLKRTKQNTEPKKKHSDYSLPRNTQIKFRTATYESPKGTIVTSTDLENRRLSQLDQQLRGSDVKKPAVSAKPAKTPEKQKPVTGSSKIPVFMSQKSLSQENLTEKRLSMPRSPPPNLSSSSGNIHGDSYETSYSPDYTKKPK